MLRKIVMLITVRFCNYIMLVFKEPVLNNLIRAKNISSKTSILWHCIYYCTAPLSSSFQSTFEKYEHLKGTLEYT